MKKFKNIAVLIDALHTQRSFLDSALDKISSFGRISVKRAYGNWGQLTYAKWKEDLNRLSIKAVQQFNYTSSKNSSDIVLVIDAMTMLLTNGSYDAYAIVSSGDDFTPLSEALSEAGKFVIGVGTEKAPENFRNSCDRFCMLKDKEQEDSAKDENDATDDVKSKLSSIESRLDSESAMISQILAALQTKTVVIQNNTVTQPAVPAPVSVLSSASASASGNAKPESSSGMDKVHKYLKEAYNLHKDSTGYAMIGEAATYLKQKMPDFSPGQYGYSKYKEMLEDFPDKYRRNGPKYKCLD